MKVHEGGISAAGRWHQGEGGVVYAMKGREGGEGLGGEGQQVHEGVIDADEIVHVTMAPFVTLPCAEDPVFHRGVSLG